MIIIVEGTDRVGKTTLVNRLADELGFKVFKDSLINPHHINNRMVMAEKLHSSALLLKALDLTKNDIVIDRFHLTEYVYGTLERITDYDAFKVVDDMMAKMNAIIIHVERTNPEFSDKAAGEDQSNHEILFNLALRKYTKCKVIKTKHGSEDIVNCIRVIRRAQLNV